MRMEIEKKNSQVQTTTISFWEKPMFKKIVIDPWPYYVGFSLLGILNIIAFLVNGNPIGITTAYADWGTKIFRALGGDPSTWYAYKNPAALDRSFFADPQSMQNMAIILGALFANLLGSKFKIRPIKSYKQVLGAIIGGLIMGYGARIAMGCNIGAFFSAVPSLSLHGWFFFISLAVGAWIGTKLLVRFFSY